MRYRVFAQGSVQDLGLEEVSRLGGGAFEFFDVQPVSGAPVPCARLGVRGPSPDQPLVWVTILRRFRREDDLEDARRAAAQGRAAGMDSLAERCETVYEVSADSPADERLVLELCAAIAAVALGPILPPDGDTLLGVRSARLRARSDR